MAEPQADIRQLIFAGVNSRRYRAEIIAERDGVIAGAQRLEAALRDRELEVEVCAANGCEIRAGNVVAKICGTAMQIATAEEFAIGMLAKPSGIATAARRAVKLAEGYLRIVCGAWKKMPPEIKPVVREAVVCGGAAMRITDEPFVYVDKNFVRMLGGIREALETVARFPDKTKVIQLKGDCDEPAREALTAVAYGADVLMVDTGLLADAEAVHSALVHAGCRDRVRLAFAKGIRLDDIPGLTGKGIDILDIGASIIDAPLLDMKLEVRGAYGRASAG